MSNDTVTPSDQPVSGAGTDILTIVLPVVLGIVAMTVAAIALYIWYKNGRCVKGCPRLKKNKKGNGRKAKSSTGISNQRQSSIGSSKSFVDFDTPPPERHFGTRENRMSQFSVLAETSSPRTRKSQISVDLIEALQETGCPKQLAELALKSYDNRQIEELSSSLKHRHLLAYDVINPEGGEITFDDGEETGISLSVPAGALSKPQLMYIIVLLDEDDHSLNKLSPTIACGPRGTKFHKPIQLTMPHCAEGGSVAAASRESNSSSWKTGGGKSQCNISSISDSSVTFNITHFTNFTLTHDDSRRRPIIKAPGKGEDSRKRLAFALFASPECSRVCFTMDCAVLQSAMYRSQSMEGYKMVTDWELMSFVIGSGPINMQPKSQEAVRRPSNVCMLHEDIVLRSQNYVHEILSNDISLEVQIYQTGNPSYAITLKRRGIERQPSKRVDSGYVGSNVPEQHLHLNPDGGTDID